MQTCHIPQRADGAVVSLSDLDRLARSIADACVICDIECHSYRDDAGWWDTRPMLDEREHCSQSLDMARETLAYADQRGLIVRHSGAPHLVGIVARPPLASAAPTL